ncbi:MAG TPA: response regulator transcription factor [Gaiellaceae bacterium]|nr:response regulator transcription factor [Gaiellaceae bacterium]
MSRILVADDDTSVLDTIAYAFEREAFEVDTVADGEAALTALRNDTYDLAILNVMMPKLYGTDVVREMQFRNGLPIVLLSARDGLAERIEGLELGADDYITKPFALDELVTRVRAILRRQERERCKGSLVRTVDNLVIDYESSTVYREGQQVALTRSEFRLLAVLVEQPGQVVSRRELMEHLWQSAYVGDERAGDIHVSNVRRKLGSDLIETVRGEGYRLRV